MKAKRKRKATVPLGDPPQRPKAQVIAALDCPVVRKAAEFGAKVVRIATGQRIVLEGNTVVTILPAENFRRQVHRVGMGRYGRATRERGRDYG